MSGYFSVKNFERFQHYKDRSPPWIKLYNELLDDYEFGRLPDASKAHLLAIWLLASRYNNKIPYDARWVERRINANTVVNLELLTKSGFIVLDQSCSNLLAERKQYAMPERETETQVETEKKSLSLRSSVPAQKRKNKSSLPENFPDEVAKKWAEEHWLKKGRADLCSQMDEEVAKFRDRQAAQNGSYADWDAAWRNWCRNAMNFAKSHRNGNGKLTGHQAFAAAALSIVREAEDRSGERDFEDAGPT